MWGNGRIEKRFIQSGLPVDWKRMFISVGTGRMEHGGLNLDVLVYRNREVFGVVYQSKCTGSSSVWGTVRI